MMIKQVVPSACVRIVGFLALLLLLAGSIVMERASAAETPEDFYFMDDFETGNLNNSNEYFEWGGTVNTSVSTDIARSGNSSLKFTYPCCTSDRDAWSEQRFDLLLDIDEIWISWYQYYPDGNELAELGKDLGPTWQHRQEGNNKLLLIGNGDWEPGGDGSFNHYGFETEPFGSGDSQVFLKWRPNGGLFGTYDKEPINGGILQDSTIRGRWVEYIAHFKIPSGWQQADGVAELWVDGLKVHNHHDLNTWLIYGGPEDAAYNVFNHGYIMGWANSGFEETSYTYIDDFTVSASPPDTLDPGDLEPDPGSEGPDVNVSECTTDPQSQWLYCDDFETDRMSEYYDYYSRWGRYNRSLGRGIGNSYAMTSYYGYYAADPVTEPHGTWLKKAWGRTPDNAYYKPSGDANEAVREVYARFFMKTNTAEEVTSPMSTGPLARLHGIGPDDTPFMNVELRYPDQSGVLQSVLSTGQFDSSGEPTGVDQELLLSGSSPVMHRSEAGSWHEIEMHVKLNTPGQSDGVYELWIDGELESSAYNLDWSGDYEDYGINAIELYNTNNQPGVAGNDYEYRAVDNLLISRSRIGAVTEEPPPLGDNIALHKDVTVSSIEGNSYEGSKAVDGFTNTRWASEQLSDPEWITIDLGSTYTVSDVILHWETAYARSYQLQASLDGTTWTDVYTTTDSDGGTDEISLVPTNTRYVRMYGTERGSEYGYSLYEFEIYGTPAAAAVSSGSLTMDDLEKPAGDSFALTAVLDQAAGSSFTVLDFIVNYDPQQVEFNTVTHEGTVSLADTAIESLLPGFAVASAVKESLGRIRVIMLAGEEDARSGSGPVLRLNGSIRGDAETGSTTIWLTDLETSRDGVSAVIDTAGATVNIEIVQAVSIDFAALDAAIAAAESRYDRAVEGTRLGQYTPSSKAALLTAIQAAKAVRNQSSVSQADADAAAAQLQQAVETFATTIVSFIDGATRITIRDLSILSQYFGITSADSNWSEAEIADLYGEGEITAQVLEAVAQMILDDWLSEGTTAAA